MSKTLNILERVFKGERIFEQDALHLIQEKHILPLGQVAEHAKKRFHPGNTASYIIDRNINYTNICESKCKFCAFYREKKDQEAYLLEKKEIFRRIEETLDLKGTQIMLQGGLHPDLDIHYFTDLLSSIKMKYHIHIHS